MNKILRFLLLVLLSLSSQVWAETPTVFEVTVNKPISEVYASVQASFKESRFFIVDELNIGKNLSNFSEKWGDEYNQSRLSAIRSIVFCNGWYANQVSNKDPKMLGLCPLHMTLIERDGKTTALFNRPTVIAKGSAAHDLLAEIEQEVIGLIEKGMR
jgi:uncharacterized protein (DUF302 family)